MHVFEGNLERTGAEFLRDSNRSFFQERVCQIGVLLSIATGFAIPVSTSLTSVLSIGVLICWFVSGQCLVTLELLKKYRVATASLVFFGFLAMGLLHTGSIADCYQEFVQISSISSDSHLSHFFSRSPSASAWHSDV